VEKISRRTTYEPSEDIYQLLEGYRKKHKTDGFKDTLESMIHSFKTEISDLTAKLYEKEKAEKPAEVLPSMSLPVATEGQLSSPSSQQAQTPQENAVGNGRPQDVTSSSVVRTEASSSISHHPNFNPNLHGAQPSEAQLCLHMDSFFKAELKREAHERALELAAAKNRAASINAQVKREELELKKKRAENSRRNREPRITYGNEGLPFYDLPEWA
jgi:hypothetical protein